jgi:hypothetical protein
MRVVVDTNVWIGFLIGKALGPLLDALSERKVLLVSSALQLTELWNVVNRPTFRKYFSVQAAKELVALLGKTAIMVELHGKKMGCRDAKDDYLLEMAVRGKAGLIITGDADLISMHPYKGIRIVNYREFNQKLL